MSIKTTSTTISYSGRTKSIISADSTTNEVALDSDSITVGGIDLVTKIGTKADKTYTPPQSGETVQATFNPGISVATSGNTVTVSGTNFPSVDRVTISTNDLASAVHTLTLYAHKHNNRGTISGSGCTCNCNGYCSCDCHSDCTDDNDCNDN